MGGKSSKAKKDKLKQSSKGNSNGSNPNAAAHAGHGGIHAGAEAGRTPPTADADIESISARLIAEIDQTYVGKDGGFKRAFFCVNESLKIWIEEIVLMEKNSKMLEDFDAEDRKEIIRQIILWNRSHMARNPRIGLLVRLMSARRDVRETIEESFAEMKSLLKEATINEKWGGIVRSHMAQLHSIFDTHSDKQDEVG